MKKIIHYLFLVVGVLMIIGVIFMVRNLDNRQSDDLSYHPGADEGHLAQVESILFLGGSIARGEMYKVRKKFGLGEKIYATILIKTLEEGDYSLNFHWIKPGGGVQETFRKKFHSPGGNYRCWSWLELTGNDLLPFSIGPFGPGKFIGVWKIRVYLNDLLLNSAEFSVE